MARAAFEEGKNHLKKKNYEDAERLFGQAAYLGATMTYISAEQMAAETEC